ncbi:MAG TPA: thioredoxin family protein [Steroidobacteraceae bacterium]|nr:thioredoxin family protein [Steroidobacteraceae bacterium]
MRASRLWWLGLFVAGALAGCKRPGTPPAAAPAARAEIAWFGGSVEEALTAAAAQHKPVFLYWGAEWCPPCHDLKAHVFSRRDFQDKMRQFIPVYLDGDAPGAQRLAGEFHVSGYPTAVVLRADRTEITRIAGGMDLTRYADVLDLALEDLRPATQLLASLRDGEGGLTAADCRRLAYNGWLLDPEAEAAPEALVISLQQAAQRCPAQASLERDRLIVTAAGLAASSERAAVEGGKPASAQLSRSLDAMVPLVADRERALQVADLLLDAGEDYFFVSHRLHPDRDGELLGHWSSLMDALETDEAYSGSVRLMSAAGRLYAAKALSSTGEIPASVQERARRTLDDYLARDYAPDERAGVINSASWVLTYLKDDARLRALLEGEIRTSRTPFYYMPDLADVYERAGDRPAALAWLEKGYRESRGPATRFQWGVLYVEGLLRMTPDDVPRIQAAASQVLGELQGPDRIHGRARTRLERLGKELGAWSAPRPRAAAATALAQQWAAICADLPPDEAARSDCRRLLSLEGA